MEIKEEIKCQVKDFQNGELLETIGLPTILFNEEWNDNLFKEVLDYYQNNYRQGTACTKQMDTISGSGRKIRRQKGGGTSRAHTNRAPQYRGGVVTFGPNGRKYSYTIPKKKKKKVLAMVLSRMLKENRITVVNELVFFSTKTKNFINHMKEIAIERCLMVTKNIDQKLFLSQRNVQFFNLIDIQRMGMIEVLRSKHLLIDKEALVVLAKRFIND